MRIRVLRYTLPWRAMETNGQNVRVELAINGHDHALDVPAAACSSTSSVRTSG